MGIWKVLWEGGAEGSRKRQVMTGDGAATLETGDAQVRGGTCGETKRDWYAGTDTGDTQVGGLFHAEARRAVSADRAGGGPPLTGKYNDGRSGQGGQE